MHGKKKRGPRICFLDIEATSLEADVGTMVGAGVMDVDGRFKFIVVPSPITEKDGITKLLSMLKCYHIIVTWNGKSFDIPFLVTRAVWHGLNVEILLSTFHLDLAEFVRGVLKLSRTDLFHVSKFLRIEKDVKTLGQDVPTLYMKAMEGNKVAMGKIKMHCRDDLEVLRAIFLKLKPMIKVSHPQVPIL